MILEKIVIGIGIFIAYFLDGSNIFELGRAIKPDFMTIFVIFFALRKGPMYGLWIGFFGGLLTDTAIGGEIGASGEVFYKIGLHSLVFSVMGYLTGKFTRSAFNENYFSVMVYVFLFTLLSRFFIYGVYSIFFHSNLNYSFFGPSIYNSVIGPASFFILTWVYRLENDGNA